ncbi:MAG: hypothetical protein OIF48_05375 [Silicimonas sp.]|nr:hypothetical protein [Silicimonas sp.]
MALNMRSRTMAYLAVVVLLFCATALGKAALRGHEAPGVLREIHLLEDENYGETVALMRFPLELTFADRTGPQPFLFRDESQQPPVRRLDQTAYEDDFDGFVAHLLKDLRFSVNGREIPPELGILSLVPVTGTDPLPPGLLTAKTLLGVCTAFPGRAEIRQIEVVMEIYLPDTRSSDPITITLDALPSETPVTTRVRDHRRTGQSETHDLGREAPR